MHLRLVTSISKRAGLSHRPEQGSHSLGPLWRAWRRAAEFLTLRRQAGFVLTPRTALFEREDGRPETLANAQGNVSVPCFGGRSEAEARFRKSGIAVADLRHVLHATSQLWYRVGADPGPLLPWFVRLPRHKPTLLEQNDICRLTPQTLKVAAHRLQTRHQRSKRSSK